MLTLAIIAIRVVGTARDRQFQVELEQVRREVAEGRFDQARTSLVELSQRRPGQGSVLLLLGRCEEAMGHPELALAAWKEVSADDPDFGRAAESLGGLLINLGRYAPAESFLLEALGQASESDRYSLLRAYARLLRLEGRFAEVSDVLKAAWGRAPNPSEVLQDLWQNDTEPVPVSGWQLFLDAADKSDDRVELGRGRHALLSGRFDDAGRMLQKCLDRRPDDSAVWRARLDLAMANANEAMFWEAAARIPAEEERPWEIAAIRVWLASRAGDPRAEEREAARLVELQPFNTEALERLATLALQSGDRSKAEQFRRRKAEIDTAKDAIHKFIIRKTDFQSRAGELARLSGVLGRRFDEQAWNLVAAGSPPQTEAASKTNENRPQTGLRRELDQARASCRDVSNAALARLLTTQTRPHASQSSSIAGQLADLRNTPVIASGDRAPDAPRRSRSDFVDDAEAVGLRFLFDNGRSPKWLLPESLSGGVGLIDFDGDGWLDVYCVQGGSLDVPLPAASLVPPADRAPGDRLFRNQGNGTFSDVTHQSGIDRLAWGRGYGQGVAVGDYDNDGHPDLFLTRLDHYELFRNRGDGTFEDATSRAGLDQPRENPTSAAFADLDNDGDLDLYVCHYLRWDQAHPPLCKNPQGDHYYCDPALYESVADRVFRNDGSRFVDVTQTAGFTDVNGRGLGVVAADVDDDNRIDLFVANDGTANFLFHNLGGFRFEEDGMTAGVAGNAEGAFRAGMGVAAADLDGDGQIDLLVTNLSGEGTTLYRNLGRGMFADQSAASGILGATRYLTGFGIAVLDSANDGRSDVAIANGHVNDFRPLYPFAMPARLFEGRPGGVLTDVSEQSGHPWTVPRLGRGLAAGDLDNDGRVDLLLMAQDEPLAYFHNRTEPAGHAVTFRIEGTESNRDGVGARVIVVAGEHRQVAQRLGGGSYLSASDGRLHFGLGAAVLVQSVEVRWPSGRIDRWKDLAVDTGYLLREGDPTPRPLPGFSSVKKGEKKGGHSTL